MGCRPSGAGTHRASTARKCRASEATARPSRRPRLADYHRATSNIEPGVSAEDCLYADLGIDPGSVGCQHYEASQFMFHQRRIDPSGLSRAVAGRRRRPGPAYRRLLVELLAQDYPLAHEVIACEAATLPITMPRMGKMPLSGIVEADLRRETTLVVPPSRPMQRNNAMLDRLAALYVERAVGNAVPSMQTDQGGTMSNVIQLLEAMGRNPGVNEASAADHAAAVASLEIDGAQQQSLLDRDASALNDLFDGRSKMFLLINTPNPDDHEAIPDDDDGDGVPDEAAPPYEK